MARTILDVVLQEIAYLNPEPYSYAMGILCLTQILARHTRPTQMGGCRNYGPFLGPYYNTAPIINGTQKGTLILTTTQMAQFEEKFLDRSPQAPLSPGFRV